MPTTLIQLISEQTVQNLLPVMRLRPGHVVHLVTPRTEPREAHVRRAFAALGLRPEVDVVGLSDMPDIAESYRGVESVITAAAGRGDDVVVNFTGGTKLMGIGAYGAATLHKVASLYVDTDRSRFLPGDQSGALERMLDGDTSFGPLLRQLRVDILAIANGMQRVTAGQDWRRLLPLAEVLFADRDLERRVHDAVHGTDGFSPGGREPRKPSAWLKVLDQPIGLPDEVAEIAADLGLLRPGGLLPDHTRQDLTQLAQTRDGPSSGYFQAVAPLQHALSLLSGAWWELIVAAGLDSQSGMHDLRWSVQVGDPDGPDQEEDLLAVQGVQLVFVSCKRRAAGQRLVPVMEEIRSRAATIGGRFNRRILAVYESPHRGLLDNMRANAARLGIELWFGDDLRRER